MGDGINSIPVAFCWKFPVWKAVRRHCHNMSWGHGYVKEGTCDSYNESSFRSKGQRSELDRNNLLYIYIILIIYTCGFSEANFRREFSQLQNMTVMGCYGPLVPAASLEKSSGSLHLPWIGDWSCSQAVSCPLRWETLLETSANVQPATLWK